jgi:hypothetical protein
VEHFSFGDHDTSDGVQVVNTPFQALVECERMSAVGRRAVTMLVVARMPLGMRV